jgi:hypothetical protein
MIKNAMYPIVVVVGVLALCSMFARPASARPVSQHVTLTGYVSCTTCLMPNACKSQTRLSYVLVVGDMHYRLSGFEKELAKAAAENSVTVSGDLNGTDLVVTTVDTAHKVK